jgi:flavin reductase (DIM6/NTAB) family NADH-FMN oxidoreductase RutF
MDTWDAWHTSFRVKRGIVKEACMADKVNLGTNAFPYPMPMVVVGAVVDGKPNFMPCAWSNRVNPRPPLYLVALGKSHLTNEGIHEHGELSVNIPSRDLVEAVDYCGLNSGRQADKSGIFTATYGELAHAPMIAECPYSMELRVVQTVDLPVETLFIGEVVAAHCDEGCLTDGQPDVKKLDPFMLTMPDNNYWSVGERVAQAWSVGKGFRATAT